MARLWSTAGADGLHVEQRAAPAVGVREVQPQLGGDLRVLHAFTGTRVPRITGVPPMIFGLDVTNDSLISSIP